MKTKRKKAIWTLAFQGQAREPRRRAVERERRLYRKEAEEFLADHLFCQVCRKGMSEDVHHKRGRGKLLRVKRHWLAVCRKCHQDIHLYPDWARSRGYLAKRGEWRKA